MSILGGRPAWSEASQLLGKLVDLLPVVRNHVDHPELVGSFSLKYILTPLVPSLSYQDLVIVDGMVASVEIAPDCCSWLTGFRWRSGTGTGRICWRTASGTPRPRLS
jgi:hypothetical protein